MKTEKYKPSIYNKILKTQNKFCAYNSFSGKLALIENIELQRILSSDEIIDVDFDNELIKKFIQDGFIVEISADENSWVMG